jgi:hypothetical protein
MVYYDMYVYSAIHFFDIAISVVRPFEVLPDGVQTSVLLPTRLCPACRLLKAQG